MKGVLTYIRRDFIRWSRNKVGVVSTLVLPAAGLIFVGIALPVKLPEIILILLRWAFL